MAIFFICGFCAPDFFCAAVPELKQSYKGFGNFANGGEEPLAQTFLRAPSDGRLLPRLQRYFDGILGE
jgi:hypothetical protein